VRRVLLLTSTCLLLSLVAGCRDDGRTLRPARPDQNQSISVPGTIGTDDPSFSDPDGSNSVPTSVVTLPPTVIGFTATAPWRDGAEIDQRYTCSGLNVAPALSWSPGPVGTAEIAVTLTDRDAPDFDHWAIAGLSATSIALNEDTVPLGAYEATNGNGDLGYTGPCPPAGTEHTYVITVHYLGSATGLGDGVPVAELLAAIGSEELASAEIIGTFSRS